MNRYFSNQLELILEDNFDKAIAAIGVVQDGDRWLLGLAKNTGDDRNGKWCHAGGHIKKGESIKKAAEREVWEETGIRCKGCGEPFFLSSHKNIAFIHCKVTKHNQKLDNNHEFTALGFFTYKELKSLKLYHNVMKLIDRVK